MAVSSGVSQVYVDEVLAPYALNNLEDADTMYIGKVSKDGAWLVQQFWQDLWRDDLRQRVETTPLQHRTQTRGQTAQLCPTDSFKHLLESDMPKSTDACNRILNLMYSATAWATVAINATASPLTDVQVALHSATLTAATNSQAENEVAYTNYTREAVARSTGWAAASGGSISNAALLQFPQSGATGATLAAVSTGTTSSGATPVWHYGLLNSSIVVGASASITPQFLAGALVITET